MTSSTTSNQALGSRRDVLSLQALEAHAIGRARSSPIASWQGRGYGGLPRRGFKSYVAQDAYVLAPSRVVRFPACRMARHATISMASPKLIGAARGLKAAQGKLHTNASVTLDGVTPMPATQPMSTFCWAVPGAAISVETIAGRRLV